jgi:hypothetical protein
LVRGLSEKKWHTLVLNLATDILLYRSPRITRTNLLPIGLEQKLQHPGIFTRLQ